jgi:hypothetical protein
MKIKLEYIGIGALIVAGAIRGAYKDLGLGHEKNRYADFKKEYKLTMPEEDIKKYMEMSNEKFEDEVIKIVGSKCEDDQKVKIRYPLDNEEKELEIIDFIRQLEASNKRLKRELEPEEMKKLSDSVNQAFHSTKKNVCWGIYMDK